MIGLDEYGEETWMSEERWARWWRGFNNEERL